MSDPLRLEFQTVVTDMSGLRTEGSSAELSLWLLNSLFVCLFIGNLCSSTEHILSKATLDYSKSQI